MKHGLVEPIRPTAKGRAIMTDSSGTEKKDGLGDEGTIPPSEEGVAAGVGEGETTFEPEEDPEGATGDDKDPLTATE